MPNCLPGEVFNLRLNVITFVGRMNLFIINRLRIFVFCLLIMHIYE